MSRTFLGTFAAVAALAVLSSSVALASDHRKIDGKNAPKTTLAPAAAATPGAVMGKSGGASTPAPSTAAIAAPSTAPTTTTPPITPPTKPSAGAEVRDHRAGGNADKCLKDAHFCNAEARNNSIAEWRKKNSANVGNDNDPCFKTKVCNKTQLAESMIARAQKNMNVGFCDSRIKGQGCAQINVLPNGKQMVLHYDHNKGHLLPADQQRFIAELERIK